MKGIALCEDRIYETLNRVLSKEGINLVRISSPEEIQFFEDELVVVQYPLGNITRGQIFYNLEKLWEKRAPITVIIKNPEVKIRQRDLRENVLIFNKETSPETIGEKIIEKLISPELLLNQGLEAYVAKNYAKAYEYWITLARTRQARNTKVFEYLKIAREEFKEAGIDLSELDAVLESRIDPFEKGIMLFSEGNLKEALSYLRNVKKDSPNFLRAMAVIEKIKEELNIEEAEEVLEEIEKEIEVEFSDIYEKAENNKEEPLSPQQAFILSLIDGKTSLKEIFHIMPITEDEFKRSVKLLIDKGYIKRRE